MKAAQISAYGGKDVLHINEVEKPSAGPDQVLVEVHAAAVNPFDVTVREGGAQQMAPLNFPATLGGDVAGVVVEISEGVTGFEIGQAVYGQANALSGHGSFAEFSPIKASQLASKPTSLDITAAAAVPLVSGSAYQALVEHLNLQTGQKILVHGGGGGIGSVAVQLAKHLGAHVTATAAADDLDYVRGLGADEVIDYQSQDFTQLVHGLDAVFDTVGGETTTKSYGVLKPGGILVSMAAQPDEALAKQHDIHFIHQFTHTTTENLTKIAELIDAGTLKIRVDKVFPLDQAAEALEYAKTGHPHGKVVIQVKAA
jgi:NADPH:quinone reductase-like Zn-dependent oxidoreductase